MFRTVSLCAALSAFSLALSPLRADILRSLKVCDDVADPATLDPHLSFDNKADGIIHHIYESFCRLDWDGKILPALAERWEETADGHLLFCLRPNIRFHDGQPCDAEAARQSLLRQRNLANSASMQLASIYDVVVESSLTIKIASTEPPQVLLRKLAVFGLIVPVKTKIPLARHPIGTGPYKFVAWEEGKRVTLQCNAEHWLSPKPYFDELIFEFIPIDDQIKALIRRDVDLIAEVSGTQTLEVAKTPGLRILKHETLTTHAYWFTSFRGPLADPEVRRALNMALDKDSLIRYAAFGNGKPISTLSMEGEMGHNPHLEPYVYDPIRARKIIERAKWPQDFTLEVFSTQQSEKEAKVIKNSFEKIGLRVNLTVEPIAEVSRIIAENRVRSFDVFANQAPDPLAHMCFLASVCFHSGSPLSAGGIPGFDERYERMMSTRDSQEHERLARELDSWIREQSLGLFTYQRIRTYGMRKDLKFNPHFTGMLMNLDRAYLE